MPYPVNFEARLSHIGNILVQMCCGIRGKDERLMMDIRSLSTSLSYLLNSTSFREGEYFNFDKSNINKRLGR
jgi:hypothetical protein